MAQVVFHKAGSAAAAAATAAAQARSERCNFKQSTASSARGKETSGQGWHVQAARVVLVDLVVRVFFFKRSAKTTVPEDGSPSGALVLTKLVE